MVRDFIIRTGRPTWVAVAGWLLLGLNDFVTGFVAFSPLRALILCGLVCLLFPLRIPAVVQRPFATLISSRPAAVAFLLALTFAGFALFFSRMARGANMADTLLFRDSIQYSSLECVLCDHIGRYSHFRGHNSPFLLLFIPFRDLPNWFMAAAWLHSASIVLWCRIAGRALGGSALTGWVVTGALFLATYVQHGTFYDTRFAALALIVFAAGYYAAERRWLVGGVIGIFLSRETAALNALMFSVTRIAQRREVRWFAVIGGLSLLWYVGSLALATTMGGITSSGHFESCLITGQVLSDPDCAGRTLASATVRWPLKLAYSLRILLFAPTLSALPSYVAALPDLAFTWLARGGVLYDVRWHYYMQALGVLLIGASTMLKQRGDLRYADRLVVRWVVAMSLWQSATTFQLNLF